MGDEGLKNCPFCGMGPSTDPHATQVQIYETLNYYAVYCEGCGCQTGEFPNREQAITAWNTRTGEEAQANIVQQGAAHHGKGWNGVCRYQIAQATWIGDPSVLPSGSKVDVLAIDTSGNEGISARTAAWVRHWPEGRDFARYRSCDLIDLEFLSNDARIREAQAGGEG